MRKAIVIGLDGGTLDVLGPMIEKGHLPGLRALMEGVAWGRLGTVIPPGTGPVFNLPPPLNYEDGTVPPPLHKPPENPPEQ